jgi:hypothetical protein
MVGGVRTRTDGDGDDCVWRIRDWLGWRHGVVFSASAGLLCAWHAAATSMPRPGWESANHRFGVLLERIRQARLGGNLDDVELACQALLHQVDARALQAPLRQAIAELREMFTRVTPGASTCLLGCPAGRCAEAIVTAHPDQHPG